MQAAVAAIKNSAVAASNGCCDARPLGKHDSTACAGVMITWYFLMWRNGLLAACNFSPQPNAPTLAKE
jgi:hypothetical protein